ncbi:TPA: helix-turn-helix transcriptional regulator [Serratia fonticola]
MITKRLKSARISAGLTQEQLGVAAGIDESTARGRVSSYETGAYRPVFETLCLFAKVLDVPECYFYIIDDQFADDVLQLYRQRSKA